MIKGHRIETFEEIPTFLDRLSSFSENTIECTEHTLFRLSEKQRKVFTCDELKQLLLHETPLKIGVQVNGNYAVYYKHKEKLKIVKVIIGLKPTIISIVTFYILHMDQLPR